MPQLACETDLDDLSGMLSLNGDAEEQINAHIRAGFNALMQRPQDVADGSDSFTETAELLHSLLENLIKVPSSSENTNILAKCLEFIQSHDLVLTQDINSHIIELLNVNNYPECEEDLCQILINSEHPLSEKQKQN